MSHEVLEFDQVSQGLLEKAERDGVETIWDRKAAMKAPCGFGEKGICCKNCSMGPCRISPVAGKGAQRIVRSNGRYHCCKKFCPLVAGEPLPILITPGIYRMFCTWLVKMVTIR